VDGNKKWYELAAKSDTLEKNGKTISSPFALFWKAPKGNTIIAMVA